MILDMYTALYITMLSFVLGTIVFSIVVLRDKNKQTPINYLLIGAFALQALGYSMFVIRDNLSVTFAVIFPNTLNITGSLLLAYVIGVKFKWRLPSLFYVFYGLFYLTLVLIFTIWNPSMVARFYLYYLFHLVLYLWNFTVIHNRRQHGDLMLYCLHIALVINNIIMIVVTSITVSMSDNLYSFSGFSFNILVYSLIVILLVMAFYILDEEKLKQQTISKQSDMDILRHVYYHAPVPSVTMSKNGDIIETNQAFNELFERTTNTDQHLSTIFDSEICTTLRNTVLTLSKQDPFKTVHASVLVNEFYTDMEIHMQWITPSNQELILVHLLDKSVISEKDKALNRFNNILYQVKAIAKIGIWELDIKRQIIYADENAHAIYGIPYNKNGIRLTTAQNLVKDDYRLILDTALDELLTHDKPYDVQFEIVTPDGQEKHIHSMASKYKIDDTVIVYGSLQDITNTVLLNQTVNQLQFYDPLTNFINQQHFNEHLHSIIQEDNLPISIIYCDLDNLSLINQTYGLDVGNEAIKVSSEILKNILPDSSLMARTGDDEFTLVIPNCTSKVVNRYIERFEKEIKGRFSSAIDHTLSWSFGYATMTNILESVEEILHQAKEKLVQSQSLYNQAKQIKALDAIMETLNSKDPYSDIHSTRVAHYAKQLARALKLPKQDIVRIESASLLHDIGKILIDNHILLKESRLTKQEYKEMQQHPINSYNIISTMPELKDIAKIVLAHHEWIDGNGYPYHIKGDSIPLESKIISIADAFDAMTGKRRYRDPYVKEEAILELLEHRGTQFDEKLVNIFIDEVLTMEKPNT